jgi:hypothetical protein
MDRKNKEIEFFQAQAKDHLERLQELEKIRDKFDLEKRGKKDELSDSQFVKYERMMIDYFGECTGLLIYSLCYLFHVHCLFLFHCCLLSLILI